MHSRNTKESLESCSLQLPYKNPNEKKQRNYGSLPPFLIISSGNRFGELAFKTHMRSQVFLCRLALQRIWKHFERREDRFQRWRFGVLRQRGLWG